MAKRSWVLALACWCLTSSLASAQFGLPNAGCEPGAPLNPWNAPPGPGEDLGLSPDTRNAFDPPKECCLECFFSVGSIALMRQRMGQAAIATNGGGETAMEFDDVRTNFNLGGRAAGGFIYGNQAIEISGFYLPAHDSSITSTDPGMTTFFTNNLGPLNAPLLLRTTLTSTIGNYEVNYRTWGGSGGLEWIIGCRYLDLLESLAILGSDGANDEVYTARTYNRIVGPSLGLEYGIPVGSSAAFTLAAKGTWGWNLVNSTVFLQNNGAINFEDETNRDFFSHVYEIAFYADMWLADPIHVRLGCQALWALHVAEAVKQINFDAQAPSIQNNQGSIMYWGPMAEIQFIW